MSATEQTAPPPAPPLVEESNAAESVDQLIEAVTEVKRREQRIYCEELKFDKTYVQKQLSFFGKLEFVKAVSAALTEAGRDISLTDALGLQGMQLSDMAGADFMLKAFLQIGTTAPDLLKEVYLLALNVPAYDRLIVSQILEMPHDEETGDGGLSDRDGIDILHTFVQQNAKTLSDFFRVEAPKVWEEIKTTLGIGSDQTQASSKQ